MRINKILQISRFGSGIALLRSQVRERPLKKLFLLACLTVALAPLRAMAEHHDRDDMSKRHMSAVEMTGIGIGGQPWLVWPATSCFAVATRLNSPCSYLPCSSKVASKVR